MFCARIPITPGDICLSFATYFVAFVVCIAERLRMSNKHLSKIIQQEHVVDLHSALISILAELTRVERCVHWQVNIDNG